MTRVFGIVDPDPERRRGLLDRVAGRIAANEGITTVRWERHGLHIIAGVGETAPIDQDEDPTGAVWVLGTVHGDPGETASAHALKQFAKQGPSGINGLNGYYLACLAEPSGAVSIGTDVLGFFPLYYWANDEALVFASDPGLVRLHPACGKRLSIEGLVGILMQGHEANGKSIWHGIIRPAAGEGLTWRSGHGAVTRKADELVPNELYFGLDYANAREFINETLFASVNRATSCCPGKAAIMLSGGMDSRLVVGHLAKIVPNTTVFSFGDSLDMEVRTAARVAKRLDLPFVRVPILFDQYASLASKRVNEEQLSNSLWDFGWLSGVAALQERQTRILNGFHGDPIMGGSAIDWGLDSQRGNYSFEAMFSKVSNWGMKLDDIVSLLDAEGVERIAVDIIEQMRSAYYALPGLPFQKSWLWGLYNRNRYHVISYAWRLSDAAWPLMPYSDREMLEVAAGMPLDHIARRRMQYDTLIKDFSALAQLPLDRNSYDDSPVVPTLWWRIRRRLSTPIKRILSPRVETRAYYRVFDINNAGWRSIRELAETERKSAHQLLRPNALAKWIPSPAENIIVNDGIRDSASRKTLLALMILAGQDPGALNA